MRKELIRQLRVLCGLSQTELGVRVGLHQTTIGKLENGHINVTRETEQKLYKAFNETGLTGQDIIYFMQYYTIQKGMKANEASND